MSAAAAGSLDSFVFSGRGYGHGVGMSQWGAWAAARGGLDHRAILAFYYPGTVLQSLSPANPELTVKLSGRPWDDVNTPTQSFARVRLRGTVSGLTLVERTGSASRTREVTQGAPVTLAVQGGKVAVQVAAGGATLCDSVELRPVAAGRVGVELSVGTTALPEREYWGGARVLPDSSGGLTVFNLVSLERYLRSVAEVDYEWAQPGAPAYAAEAVKAQAVASRSYAVANRDPYLNDNHYDQVYRGYSWEVDYPGIAQAAEGTANQVLVAGGGPISAFFSSSSGGYTTTWGAGGDAWVVAKPDPYSLEAPPDGPGPGYPWTFTISAADLTTKIGGMRDAAGHVVDVGGVTRVEVASRDSADPASHAATLRLTGSKGAATVSAAALRARLGYDSMRSTLIVEVRNPGFSDVPPQHYYYAAIMRVGQAGLVGGFPDGTFRPENAVSRWQFAKMAVGLHNARFPDDQIPVVDVSGQPFWDVAVHVGVVGDESDWVAAAKKAGLVNGVSPTSFAAYAPVRRDQMATMLVRALGWEDEAAALPPGTTGFGDVAPSSPHFGPAAYLKSLEVLQGYEEPPGSGTFLLHAAEPTIRAHVAVVLRRVLDRP